MKSASPEETLQIEVTPTQCWNLFNLGDAGLLWLINETVFWPRGFCLTVGTNAETGENVWWLEGDGTEPWQVSKPESAQRRFQQANAFLASVAKHNREIGAYK